MKIMNLLLSGLLLFYGTIAMAARPIKVHGIVHEPEQIESSSYQKDVLGRPTVRAHVRFVKSRNGTSSYAIRQQANQTVEIVIAADEWQNSVSRDSHYLMEILWQAYAQYGAQLFSLNSDELVEITGNTPTYIRGALDDIESSFRWKWQDLQDKAIDEHIAKFGRDQSNGESAGYNAWQAVQPSFLTQFPLLSQDPFDGNTEIAIFDRGTKQFEWNEKYILAQGDYATLRSDFPRIIADSLENPRIGLRKDLAEQILAIRRAHPFDVTRGEVKVRFERVADLRTSEYRMTGVREFLIRLGSDFGSDLRKNRDFLTQAFLQAYRRTGAPIFLLDADQFLKATGFEIAEARHLLHWFKSKFGDARYDMKRKEVERRLGILARERGVDPIRISVGFDSDMIKEAVDTIYLNSPVYSAIFVLSGDQAPALAYEPPKDLDVYGRGGFPFGLEMTTRNDQTGVVEPFGLSRLREWRNAVDEAAAARRAKPIQDDDLEPGRCNGLILGPPKRIK